ncbi:hypothetical protein RJT34_14660 [Clitoria ternatea]|uniref:Fe2OG dioxygenase domain-containing protein n=1 Tax=Clitoria ternatea TaxID=43366 RepID=A0AAN9JSX5_CLITE
MEKLLSCRSNLKDVPESYILPSESRPGKEAPPCNMVPQIIQASQEFGHFQLVNHGIPNKLLDDVMQVVKGFFELPTEKENLYSKGLKQSCRLYTNINYASEGVHYWRDAPRQPCHPLEEHIQNWPHKPTLYRDVMGSFSVKLRELSLQIWDMICEGLGLEFGYFNDEHSSVQLLTINHYPPCLDASLTLGLPKHSDVNLITLLYRGEMHGLQIWKDEQWYLVEPIPNALVVNIGHMLQIVSNGKLKSGDHRVMTSKEVARTTIGSFIHPSVNCQIEPAKALVDEWNPPLYMPFQYKDFLSAYIADTHARLPPLDRYKLQ